MEAWIGYDNLEVFWLRSRLDGEKVQLCLIKPFLGRDIPKIFFHVNCILPDPAIDVGIKGSEAQTLGNSLMYELS